MMRPAKITDRAERWASVKRATTGLRVGVRVTRSLYRPRQATRRQGPPATTFADRLSLDSADATAIELSERAELAKRNHVLLAAERGSHAGEVAD
jgi:hypothetical protein